MTVASRTSRGAITYNRLLLEVLGDVARAAASKCGEGRWPVCWIGSAAANVGWHDGFIELPDLQGRAVDQSGIDAATRLVEAVTIG